MANTNLGGKDTSPANTIDPAPVDTSPPQTVDMWLWVYQVGDRYPEGVIFQGEEAARYLPPEARGRSFKRGLFKLTIPMSHLNEVK